MTAQHSADTQPDAHADQAPPQQKSKRRPAARSIIHGVLLVALTAGIFGLPPRLGGLTHDAAGLRHARPAFLAAAVVAQASAGRGARRERPSRRRRAGRALGRDRGPAHPA
jgi:CelD/BcsL family acetyltransferase involved in cellulose biosynthesis